MIPGCKRKSLQRAAIIAILQRSLLPFLHVRLVALTPAGCHCANALMQVLRVLPELRPPGAVRWSPPSACPACGGPVELAAATTKGGGDQLMCISPGCSAKAEREVSSRKQGRGDRDLQVWIHRSALPYAIFWG